MATPDAVRRHYAYQQRIAAATITAARSTWRQVSIDDLDGSWLTAGRRLFTLTSTAQQAAAIDGAAYVPLALDEIGIDAPPVGRVRVDPLVGVASDGRPLDSLLRGSLIRTKELVGAGASSTEAMAGGLISLERILQTQLADAGRAAASVAIAARPRVGYVRMLQTPSCSRCAVLAGKWFRYNQGFQRHPRCFPAGVTVSGPATQAATRRWYKGELVIIRTATGEELPVTGNHPVLTDRGWVPANLLNEGDHVVRSTRGEGAIPLVVPHEQQMPSRIEDLWRPDRMVTLRQVPTAPEDFHGDGGHGDVDVVLADGLLRDWFQSANAKLPEEEQFTGRIAGSADFAGLSAADEPVDRLLHATHGFMCGGSLRSTFARGHRLSPDLPRRRPVTDLDYALQALADSLPGYAKASAECILALSCLVRRRDLLDGQWEIAPRWDAPPAPFTVESRGAYASRGEDLRLRLTGQVTSDRIVELRRVEWSGHVYNLTSVEGWYSANGLIVSNCDCRHIPATEDVAGDLTTDPRKAIEQGQVTGLSRADTRAIIDDHADVGQVINSRRGMTSAGTTLEGTTRRGFAGKRLQAAGDSFTGERTGRYRRATQRLRPEAIYQQAATREEAQALLRAHGYLI